MTAIPDGIRPESARNPHTIPPESALNEGKGSEVQGIPTSSQSDAQRGGERFDIDEATALARVIASLRPDWRYNDIRRAIAADDRPWSVVALACIRGAVDDTMRHPNGLRYANAAGETSDAARHPSARTLAEVRATTWCEGCGQPYSRCMCEGAA